MNILNSTKNYDVTLYFNVSFSIECHTGTMINFCTKLSLGNEIRDRDERLQERSHSPKSNQISSKRGYALRLVELLRIAFYEPDR